MMKTGLIMEGGAMRGLFTAGVIDVMLENGIQVDGAIGVSAGAAFGCNYKSAQAGRVLRYNTKYCNDPRYCSVRSLIKTGDMYGAKFCYEEIPQRLDVFDLETFRKSPMDFYVVCTDVLTGEAVYHKCEQGDGEDTDWIRASASMPIVSQIVKVNGYELLDGGIADSIPLRYFESIGYNKNIVILTQPQGYVKNKNKFLPIIRMAMKKYPKVIKSLEKRHEMYNATIKYITMKEAAGEVFVIRPSSSLEIGVIERKPQELKRVYEMGRATAINALPELKAFIGTMNISDNQS